MALIYLLCQRIKRRWRLDAEVPLAKLQTMSNPAWFTDNLFMKRIRRWLVHPSSTPAFLHLHLHLHLRLSCWLSRTEPCQRGGFWEVFQLTARISNNQPQLIVLSFSHNIHRKLQVPWCTAVAHPSCDLTGLQESSGHHIWWPDHETTARCRWNTQAAENCIQLLLWSHAQMWLDVNSQVMSEPVKHEWNKHDAIKTRGTTVQSHKNTHQMSRTARLLRSQSAGEDTNWSETRFTPLIKMKELLS